MILFVEHVGLPALDPVAAKDWYVRVLEGTVVYEEQGPPPVFFVQLPGGLSLEIYQATSARAETHDNKLAGWRHLAFRVESIERARLALESRGVIFTLAPSPATGGGRVLYFEDPEGNLVHLTERPDGATVFTRRS